MKRLPIILAIVLMSNMAFLSRLNAQIDDLGTFFATGTDAGQQLLKEYLSPWINGFGASLTGGWYTTAKVHKLGGFDLTISANSAFIPAKYKSYDVSALNLGSLKLANGATNISPTVAGKPNKGPQLDYYFSGQDMGKAFDLLQGTSLSMIPSPMAQLSVGLIKGTEITGRYIPKVKIGKNNNIGYWGIGLKHGLKQWLPFIKKIPFLNLTLQGGYTRLTSNLGLTVSPMTIGLPQFENSLPASTWDNQNLKMQISSFTANLIVSADIPFVTFYGGLGFATTKATLSLQGVYPGAGFDKTTGQLTLVPSKKDPISFKVKNQDGGVTKPRVDIGMRLKLGVITLFGDYTYANYSLITLGLGVTFR